MTKLPNESYWWSICSKSSQYFSTLHSIIKKKRIFHLAGILACQMEEMRRKMVIIVGIQ